MPADGKRAGDEPIVMVHSLNIDVSRYATHWGLRLASDIIGTSQAYIIFGYRQTIPVALKIRRSAMQNADDKDYSTLALQSFAGNGAVRCIDQFADAVLLEQVMPGTPLSARSPAAGSAWRS